MCGITGILNLDGAPASQPSVERMADAIIHRGPDGYGYWVDGPVALGHRRLSIIDLSDHGRQPMQTADGRYIITYNGEIYNYRELTAELSAKGYRFQSRSDTEVMLYAFAAWGVGALTRFNGMFAFAIWDRQLKRLTLARDRYGIKPLYFTQTKDSFLFASEAKAFRAHPHFRADMDTEGLLEYFTFQNFFTSKTLLKGVRMLPAGCYCTIGGDGSLSPRIVRYWDYSFEEPETPRSEADYLEELDHLMQQAINRQLVSDVDVGAYLSGGMDSGTVTAVAAKSLKYMRTFTCGFDLSSASGIELNFDERAAADDRRLCRLTHLGSAGGV